MTLNFSIEYRTEWGQNVEVELCFLSSDGKTHWQRIPLETDDGLVWKGVCMLKARGRQFRYSYIITAQTAVVRREWDVVPRCPHLLLHRPLARRAGVVLLLFRCLSSCFRALEHHIEDGGSLPSDVPFPRSGSRACTGREGCSHWRPACFGRLGRGASLAHGAVEASRMAPFHQCRRTSPAVPIQVHRHLSIGRGQVGRGRQQAESFKWPMVNVQCSMCSRPFRRRDKASSAALEGGWPCGASLLFAHRRQSRGRGLQ